MRKPNQAFPKGRMLDSNESLNINVKIAKPSFERKNV